MNSRGSHGSTSTDYCNNEFCNSNEKIGKKTGVYREFPISHVRFIPTKLSPLSENMTCHFVLKISGTERFMYKIGKSFLFKVGIHIFVNRCSECDHRNFIIQLADLAQ